MSNQPKFRSKFLQNHLSNLPSSDPDPFDSLLDVSIPPAPVPVPSSNPPPSIVPVSAPIIPVPALAPVPAPEPPSHVSTLQTHISKLNSISSKLQQKSSDLSKTIEENEKQIEILAKEYQTFSLLLEGKEEEREVREMGGKEKRLEQENIEMEKALKEGRRMLKEQGRRRKKDEKKQMLLFRAIRTMIEDDA